MNMLFHFHSGQPSFQLSGTFHIDCFDGRPGRHNPSSGDGGRVGGSVLTPGNA